MNKEENEKVTKMNSCDGCSFCLSKCPICGSVNIGVKYLRYYEIYGYDLSMRFSHSDAFIYCYDCNPEIEESDPYEFEAEWNIVNDEDRLKLKSKNKPELAIQLDKHFDNGEIFQFSEQVEDLNFDEDLNEFVDTYTYKNDTIDEIHLNKDDEPFCLYDANFKLFDDIPSELSYLIGSDSVDLICEKDKDNPGKHFVVNTTHTTRRILG
jgi:hypothetical protein